jgi:HSP20 family molecular chaperone IbpA
VAARFFAGGPADFERLFDELFDDLLIGRWRQGRVAAESEHAVVHDYPDRYEVLIALGAADPGAVEVEVSERRLTVRIPDGPAGMNEGSFSFSEAVQRDAVRAKAREGVLAIVLPKLRRVRRVPLEQP